MIFGRLDRRPLSSKIDTLAGAVRDGRFDRREFLAIAARSAPPPPLRMGCSTFRRLRRPRTRCR